MSSLDIIAPVSDVSSRFEQTLWYAACTASRHEKQVARHIEQRGIDHFLPQYQTVHRWKNGLHRLQLPLFPGYIFVRMTLHDRRRVLEVPGMVRFVEFGGTPCPIPETEINSVKLACESVLEARPYPYLVCGTQVEIWRGPLQGTTGILLRRKGQCRIVISVELIMRSMVVEVDAADVLPLKRGLSTTAFGRAIAS